MRTPWGMIAVAAGLAIFFAIGGGGVWLVLRIPEGSPLARMYRTEADLRVLATAVERYQHVHGSYPPAGPGGLRLATDLLSRDGLYLPDGPPDDAWGRAFHYVPHGEYHRPGSGALRAAEGGFWAPDAYQLYSFGADGDAGAGRRGAQADNINSWDAGRSWRAHYRAAQRAYRTD